MPGIAAAVPMATAAVPIIAWCSLPIDSARTSRSMSAAATCLPLDDDVVGRRRDERDLRRVLALGRFVDVLDQAHAHRAVRADRLEHRQRLRIAVDRVLQLGAGVADAPRR